MEAPKLIPEDAIWLDKLMEGFGEVNPPDFAVAFGRRVREEEFATDFLMNGMCVGEFLDNFNQIYAIKERFGIWKSNKIEEVEFFGISEENEDFDIIENLSLYDVSVIAWNHYENACRNALLDATTEEERDKEEKSMMFWSRRAELVEEAAKL